MRSHILAAVITLRWRCNPPAASRTRSHNSTRRSTNNPNDADALYELARMHKNASLQAIERLKTIDPDSFQLHALMGEVYAEEKRYSDAIKEYRSALDKRPNAQGIHFSIGVAYWAQRQPADAQKEFRLALKENPGDPMTNLYLGDIAVQEQRFPEALTYLQVAQKSTPGGSADACVVGKLLSGTARPGECQG